MLSEEKYVRDVANLLAIPEPSSEIVERINYYREQGLGVQSAFHQMRIVLGLSEMK